MRFKFKPPQPDKATKAPDIMVVVDVELLDLYRGSEFNVTFTRQEICDHCNGTGAEHKVAIAARRRPRARGRRSFWRPEAARARDMRAGERRAKEARTSHRTPVRSACSPRGAGPPPPPPHPLWG